MQSYADYLRSKGYFVPPDDNDEIIRMGQMVMELERAGKPLPKFLDWSE